MRVGMIGTGAISHKHAEAYRNIGYQLTVCTDINPDAGRRFAVQHGAEFVESYGGRVHLATLRQGVSTTGLLRRLGAA